MADGSSQIVLSSPPAPTHMLACPPRLLARSTAPRAHPPPRTYAVHERVQKRGGPGVQSQHLENAVGGRREVVERGVAIVWVGVRVEARGTCGVFTYT